MLVGIIVKIMAMGRTQFSQPARVQVNTEIPEPLP